MSEIIDEYLIKFGTLPPKDVVIPFKHEIYQKLMKEALKKGQPITPEQLEEAIGDQPYDYVEGEESEVANYKEHDIRKLLAEYGAKDEEIENFIGDLKALNKNEEEPEVEEEDEFDYFGQIDELKRTEEGRDLIQKAPKLSADELKEAIKKLTQKH